MRTNYSLKHFIAIFILITPFLSFSQRPARVTSIIRENHTFEYYRSMAEQWKKILLSNPKDADAWFNYYYANRYAKMYGKEYGKITAGYLQPADQIVSEAGKNIPGTFEYYFIKGSEIHDESLFTDQNFRKAYDLRPDDPLTYPSLVIIDEAKGDYAGKAEILHKWFNSNECPASLLNYNYNVLASLPEDAVIITQGDNDTYPLWLLQKGKGIKPGVKVINIYLISNYDEYRKRVFSELDIPQLEFTGTDMPADVIRHILVNSSRPAFLAATVPSEYYEGTELEKDLYLTGLVLSYSKNSIDNLALIRSNYENKYLLDYLKMGFSNDAFQSLMAYMNLGYEPMLLKLYSHYLLSGENAKAEAVKSLGLKIAGDAGMEADYESRFK